GARRGVILVGKGITFDSGGLSLKPPKSMETMKYDMAGGAAVIGAVAAAARLGLPVDVTAFVPATENLPGGQAQKPGDVIRFLNGKTVEVLNTDAEGRLVLADALALASREKPDAVIDLATLTGSCRAALGTLFAGVMGNDERLVAKLIEAGRAASEPRWALELGVLERGEDLAEARARGVAEGDQVAAAEEARRPDVLVGRQLRPAALAELDVTEVAVRGERVDAREREQLVEARLAQHLLEGREAHLGRLHEAEVVAHQVGDALPDAAAPPQALADRDRHLGADALGRDVGDGRRRGRDRGACRGLDREAEAGGEADGAQHAQAVLGDPRLCVADRADDAGAQVHLPADEVDDLALEGVEEE